MAQCRLGPRTEAPSWTAEIKAHEHQKRRFVHEGLLKGPAAKKDKGQVFEQERFFDPILQRFRDPAVEVERRALEEKERVAHLNRALDVQIMRESNTHVLMHESRTAPIDKVEETTLNMDVNTMSMPPTMIDYNLISNLPNDKHHWAKPSERPRAVQREPHVRKVQAGQLRDFNIVSNRYISDHEAKIARDQKLNNLELTHKYRTRCRFDPIMQKYNERDIEERHRCCDDARDVEVQMRSEACVPPTLAGRLSAHYDIVTHRADDEGTINLKLVDVLENQRKSRYKARYVDEHNQRMADVRAEDGSTNQRHEFVAHERWEETTRRGYHIINNKAYGDGPKLEKLHEPFTVPRLGVWEKVLEDRSGLTPAASSRGSSGGAAQASRSARSPGAGATPQGSTSARAPLPSRVTPRTLSDAGCASLGSARGSTSGKPPTGPAPPPPPIPGSPVGSVYSRRVE